MLATVPVDSATLVSRIALALSIIATLLAAAAAIFSYQAYEIQAEAQKAARLKPDADAKSARPATADPKAAKPAADVKSVQPAADTESAQPAADAKAAERIVPGVVPKGER